MLENTYLDLFNEQILQFNMADTVAEEESRGELVQTRLSIPSSHPVDSKLSIPNPEIDSKNSNKKVKKSKEVNGQGNISTGYRHHRQSRC
jgi:hypothetical protein